MQENNSTFGIYHNLTIKASTEKVFSAISEPEHLVNWWPLRCAGKATIGSEYNFYYTPEYNWYGKVSQLEPNKSFHIKMTKSDLDWNPTSFDFDLEEKDGTVHLSFSHINWINRNEHFKIASFCWAMLLKGLKDYVEKGIILPFEERN